MSEEEITISRIHAPGIAKPKPKHPPVSPQVKHTLSRLSVISSSINKNISLLSELDFDLAPLFHLSKSLEEHCSNLSTLLLTKQNYVKEHDIEENESLTIANLLRQKEEIYQNQAEEIEELRKIVEEKKRNLRSVIEEYENCKRGYLKAVKNEDDVARTIDFYNAGVAEYLIEQNAILKLSAEQSFKEFESRLNDLTSRKPRPQRVRLSEPTASSQIVPWTLIFILAILILVKHFWTRS
jgi:hypothetical protein